MPNIRYQGRPNQMACDIRDVPAFPGEGFGLGYPESIGDTARSVWFGNLTPTWETGPAGEQVQLGEQPGELRYTMTVTSTEDYVDATFAVTNLSERVWEQSHAFCCCQCGGAPSTRDHDCLRTWVGLAGRPVPLRSVPRVFSIRPTVQLYSVEGAPPGMRIPFVAGFRATPEVTLEGWMAIANDDGTKLVATVAKPAMYLFQNQEYSCIHAAVGFGRLEPGQTGSGLNRTYYVTASLADWYARMKREMG